MLFFALLLEVTGILAADGGHHWTYEGPHGQDHWPDSYPECGSSAQSPIDIQTDCVTFDPELPALRLHGYEQPGVEPLDLHNNGHTVQLSLPPTLELGGLPRKYVAAQLHLHWGQKGSPGGSEHQINSEATAAELHIVHYDSDSYSSLNEAAHRPLGLAVLGVLIEVSDLQSFPARSTSSALPGPISWPASSQDGWAAATHPVHEYLTPFILSRSDNLRASLQCERAAPPTAGAVLPLQRLAHHAPLLPERALDSLQPQGPDFSGPEEEPSEALVQNYRAPQPLNQRTVVASFAQVGPLYTTGEMLSLGVGILLGCLCLLLAVYFIARKIRKKRLGNRKSVVFTSAGATREA
ncbi:carbonic anhydrase 14 isoform X10 [Fukomys damarensis]|uniref:carbonic anhydrase 14 isoform X10 n=1 Tax=Fukomys damarensis TaxID=885580 RepID=UPI00053F317A|nr:carbonic anhydrase 14 isoform X10 [Fukomys damarensis]